MITALCRLGGHPVAVVANQPLVLAGSIDADGADKAAHFITVADSFHLPLVFLSDNPGVLPGSASEKQGILRKGARMYAAQTLATAPKFEVTLRKAYGFGSMVMGMIPFDGQSGVFAFPGATMGAMGAAAMSRAKGSDEDEAAMLRKMELAGVVRIGEDVRLRRAHRPARDPQHPPALARTCALPPPGAGRAGRPHRHRAVAPATALSQCGGSARTRDEPSREREGDVRVGDDAGRRGDDGGDGIDRRHRGEDHAEHHEVAERRRLEIGWRQVVELGGFNVAIARIMELVNASRKAMDGSAGPADPAVREAAEVVTIALSLVAPYVAEEMWERLGRAPSVAKASWPSVDQSLLVTESVTCVVQIQGKVRGRLQVPPEISEDELRSVALADKSVVRALAGRDVAKVIIRAPKLVSIVVR